MRRWLSAVLSCCLVLFALPAVGRADMPVRAPCFTYFGREFTRSHDGEGHGRAPLAGVRSDLFGSPAIDETGIGRLGLAEIAFLSPLAVDGVVSNVRESVRGHDLSLHYTLTVVRVQVGSDDLNSSRRSLSTVGFDLPFGRIDRPYGSRLPYVAGDRRIWLLRHDRGAYHLSTSFASVLRFDGSRIDIDGAIPGLPAARELAGVATPAALCGRMRATFGSLPRDERAMRHQVERAAGVFDDDQARVYRSELEADPRALALYLVDLANRRARHLRAMPFPAALCADYARGGHRVSHPPLQACMSRGAMLDRLLGVKGIL